MSLLSSAAQRHPPSIMSCRGVFEDEDSGACVPLPKTTTTTTMTTMDAAWSGGTGVGSSSSSSCCGISLGGSASSSHCHPDHLFCLGEGKIDNDEVLVGSLWNDRGPAEFGHPVRVGASEVGHSPSVLGHRPERSSKSAMTAPNRATTTTTKHVHVGGLTDESLQHVYDALAMIEPTQKEGWELAKLRCPPAVLQGECCPCYFLAACESNPWDAASRLCAYWTERIEFFEGDRAFEALTIGSEDRDPTGLSAQDVEILETGCTQLLPPDRLGRSVYFLNESLLHGPDHYNNTQGRVRVLWYILQKAYTSGAPQAHRIVTLIQMVRPPRSGYNLGYCAGGRRLAVSLPIIVDDIHLLTLPAATGTGRILQLGIATCFNFVGSFFKHLVKIHHGEAATATTGTVDAPSADSTPPNWGAAAAALKSSSRIDLDVEPRRRLAKQLRQQGLAKKGLPESVGGLVTAERFQDWLNKQRRLEKRCAVSPDERAQRRREINKMHSQKKRQRRRRELDELRVEIRDLEEANQRARKIQSDLQLLVDKATGFVQGLESAGVPAATLIPPQLRGGNVVPAAQLPESSLEQPYNVPSFFPPPLQQQQECCDGAAPEGASFASILAALEPDPIAHSYLPGAGPLGSPWTTESPLHARVALAPQLPNDAAPLQSGAFPNWNEQMHPTAQCLPSESRSDPYSPSGRSSLCLTPHSISPPSLQHLTASQVFHLLNGQQQHRGNPYGDVVHPTHSHAGPSKASHSSFDATKSLLPSAAPIFHSTDNHPLLTFEPLEASTFPRTLLRLCSEEYPDDSRAKSPGLSSPTTESSSTAIGGWMLPPGEVDHRAFLYAADEDEVDEAMGTAADDTVAHMDPFVGWDLLS